MRLPRMSGNAWVCTIITLILLASGTEQAIRALQNKPLPAPQPVPAGPNLGEAVPEFTLPDENGKQHSLAQFRGKPLVVNFYCGCSRCEGVARLLAGWQKQKNVPMIGIVTFQPEYFKEWREKTGIQYPMVLDPQKEVGARWDSMICPRIWVVDAKGRAVWTNPPEPDMMTADQTAYFAKQAFAKPVPPPMPKNEVAATEPKPVADSAGRL